MRTMSKIKDTDAQKLLFDFGDELTKDNLLKTANPKSVDRLLATFRNLSRQEIDKFIKKLEPNLRREMRTIYKKWLRGGYKKYFPYLKPYRLEELKPKFRKELDDKVVNSLSLIKTQEHEFMSAIENRFRNWATISSEQLRGRTQEEKNKMIREQIGYASTKHQQFVITDQTRKLIGSLNELTAKEAGAIAGIWHNQRDKRVVGNPNGKYKPTSIHENHWAREGKLYILRDSWAVKRGYLEPKNKITYAEDISDGMPSIPIGCRCYFEYIFNLDEIPQKFQEIITESGEKFMNK